MAGAAFGSCLKGQDVVARAAGGVRNRGRRSVRQLSKGTGCWRARGGGRAKLWQAHLHWNLSGRQALQVPRGEALRWTSD